MEKSLEVSVACRAGLQGLKSGWMNIELMTGLKV